MRKAYLLSETHDQRLFIKLDIPAILSLSCWVNWLCLLSEGLCAATAAGH